MTTHTKKSAFYQNSSVTASQALARLNQLWTPPDVGNSSSFLCPCSLTTAEDVVSSTGPCPARNTHPSPGSPVIPSPSLPEARDKQIYHHTSCLFNSRSSLISQFRSADKKKGCLTALLNHYFGLKIPSEPELPICALPAIMTGLKGR